MDYSPICRLPEKRQFGLSNPDKTPNFLVNKAHVVPDVRSHPDTVCWFGQHVASTVTHKHVEYFTIYVYIYIYV